MVHAVTIAPLNQNGKVTLDLTRKSPKNTVEDMGDGKGKAKAILVQIPAWKCSNCGRIMPLVSQDQPPRRCSNRKTCGAVFRNGITE